MALTELWFGPTAAGAGDGTSYADRADLFSSGNWASEITGHDFSANGLICYIGPGTYSQGQVLQSSILTSYSGGANPIILWGCDSSGDPLEFDDGWQSAESHATWEASLPDIVLSTGNGMNLNYITVRGIKWQTAATSSVLVFDGNNNIFERCSFVSNYNNSGAYLMAISTGVWRDCVFSTAGTSWSHFLAPVRFSSVDNCRFIGATGGSGTRNAISVGTSDSHMTIQRCTFIDFPGAGIAVNNSSTGQQGVFARNTFDGCGIGVALSATASQLRQYHVNGNMITNSGTYGIDAKSLNCIATRNRISNSGTGDFTSFGNYPTDIDNEVSAGSDGDEYVNAGSNDFRIKDGSAIHGMGYGAGDEPATGGTTTVAMINRRTNSLTLR